MADIDATLCPDTEVLLSHIADMEPADREDILIARCQRLELRAALLEKVLEVMSGQAQDQIRLAKRTLEAVQGEDL